MKLKPKSEYLSEQFKKQNTHIHQENKSWELCWNKLISLRNQAQKLEKSGKYLLSIETYHACINFGKETPSLNFNNYVHDIERVIILLGKTKQKKELISFLEKLIGDYPNEISRAKWEARLTKLNPIINLSDEDVRPEDIEIEDRSEKTIGERVIEFKESLPEFNFYFDMPDGMETFTYLRLKNLLTTEQSTGYRQLRQGFKIILEGAKVAENNRDFKQAIETYIKIINEDYEGKEPYERLMVLYRKLKWKEQEIVIIEKGIDFFDTLKNKQREYVIGLAEKYGKKEFALNLINNNKRIQYYGGMYDLFNPYPFIDKWNLKLDKLKS